MEYSFENKIKEYCQKNQLNYDLLRTLKRMSGIDMIKYQRTENGEDVTVLAVFGYGDNLVFEQTEYTQKYLSA